MTAPKITFRKIETLTPDPNNARTHSDAQTEQIANSIRRFGWTNPVLADDLIRAGHGRVAAALLIYGAGEQIHMAPGKDNGGPAIPIGTVPVLDCSGWTPEERRAYALADNQLALNAGWNETILANELLALRELNFDIPLVGFDNHTVIALTEAAKPKGNPNAVVEPPAQPVSKLGDIWILGNHRIINGSSTDPECVKALLAGCVPHLMVTDPPYGVEYDASWREKAGVNMQHQKVSTGKVLNDDRADWQEAWDLFPGDVAYVWHGALHAPVVARSLEESRFEIRGQIIWNKPQLIISRGHYHWKHEPCWYAVRKGATGHWVGDRKQTSVWDIGVVNAAFGNVEDGKTDHSTQKPLECMRRPIVNNSNPGDAIYEPFSGSGTTIIAAEDTGRRCYAVELNEAYVDMAVLRWQNFTGEVATLEATGQTYEQVKAERVPA